MKKWKLTMVLGAALAMIFSLSSVATATSTYASQTGKTCTYCHNGDYSLNSVGQKFKADGYKLIESTTTLPTATLETTEKIKQSFTSFSSTTKVKQVDYINKLAGVTFLKASAIGNGTTSYLYKQQAIYWGIVSSGWKASADKISLTSVNYTLKGIADSSNISTSYRRYVAYALQKKMVVAVKYNGKYYVYPKAIANGSYANAIITKVAANNPPVIGNTYVGSAACKKCHAGAFNSWKSTPHSKMVQKIPRNADGTLAANYKDVVVIPDEAWAKQLTTSKTGGPIVQFTLDYIKIPGFSDGINVPFAYTIGSQHKQRFMIETKGKGNIMGWKILGQEYVKLDGSQGDLWQDYGGDKWKSWYVCAGCHATGVKTTITPNADPSLKGTTQVSVNELSIGCEACHGPAAKHVYSKGKKFNINVEGKAVTLPYKTTNSFACNACHNRGWNNFTTQDVEYIPNYMPWEDNGTFPETRYQETGWSLKATATTKKFSGDGTKKEFSVGESFATNAAITVKVDGVATTDFTIIEPTAENKLYTLPKISLTNAPAAGTENVEITYYGYNGAADFWGSNINSYSKSHHQEYLDWKRSKHAQNGVTCASCHTAHDIGGAALVAPQLKATGDQLCTTCHTTVKKPTGFELSNNTCIQCHMPGMAKSGVLGDIASHNFKALTKVTADALGIKDTDKFIVDKKATILDQATFPGADNKFHE